MTTGVAKGSSKQREAPLTAREIDFSKINLEQARTALAAFENQAEFQQFQENLARGAIGDLGGVQDFLSTISPEERAALTQQQFVTAREGVGLLGDLSTQERERLGLGGGLSDAEEQRIAEAEAAQIAAGSADIEGASRRALEVLREELAPRLGLRSSDTPIIDRGGRIAREAIREVGTLTSRVRGQGVQTRLASRQLGLSERGFAGSLGQAATQTAEAFRQRAFENRLALTGQVGAQGLGLATGFNTVAAQAAQRPTVLTTTKNKDITVVSSSRFKDLLGRLETSQVLAAVRAITLHRWRYKHENADEHVGPTAEDFREAFGIGNGETIHIADALGVLFGAVQELAKEVAEMRVGAEA